VTVAGRELTVISLPVVISGSTVTVVIMGPQVIDTRSPEPSYLQLARQLRDRIRAGEYEPGGPLPSIQRMVQETGLAVNTVRLAVAVLADEGWVVTVPGRGTYAAEKLPPD
jgi:GntR family transcriptional regulator